MDLPAIVVSSLWAALFATGLGVMLTAPARYLVPTLVCGFVGTGVRDVLKAWSLGAHWATVIAAAAVVLVAVAITRRHAVSPVVLICGVLPLGASVAMFKLIVGVMQISSLTGEALSGASVALTANLGKVFTTSVAMVMGLGAGMAIVRLFRREEPVAV
jgi:hypothetical protein